jgi:hypothetical protein
MESFRSLSRTLLELMIILGLLTLMLESVSGTLELVEKSSPTILISTAATR